MEGEGANQTRKDLDLNSETDYFWKVPASAATSDLIPPAALQHCCTQRARLQHAVPIVRSETAPGDSRYCAHRCTSPLGVFGSCTPLAALDSAASAQCPALAAAICAHGCVAFAFHARCFAKFPEVAQARQTRATHTPHPHSLSLKHTPWLPSRPIGTSAPAISVV
jgi:hypothetical protein